MRRKNLKLILKPSITLCLLWSTFPMKTGFSQVDIKHLDYAYKTYLKSSKSDAQVSFFALFKLASPEERTKIWLKDEKRSFLGSREISDYMVIRGIDTIPYLTNIVRNSRGEDRLLALRLLCDMDRFVPLKSFPLKEDGGTIKDYYYSEWEDAVKNGGNLDKFMFVDGRRIGSEAKELIYWAAEQDQDKDLRFHAREHSGLLNEDYRKFPTEQLKDQWVTSVKKQGRLFNGLVYTNEYTIFTHSEQILMERPAEVVPLMVKLLSEEKNLNIKEAILNFIQNVDNYAMRLRSTDIGQKAIQAIRQYLDAEANSHSLRSRKIHFYFWKSFSNQVYEDNTEWGQGRGLLLIAEAFEQYYGEKTTQIGSVSGNRVQKDPIPEMRAFLTYMTTLDPFFPGWEFTQHGCYAVDAIMHPLFKKKMGRYYECWKQFRTIHPYKAMVQGSEK